MAESEKNLNGKQQQIETIKKELEELNQELAKMNKLRLMKKEKIEEKKSAKRRK